MSLYAGYHPKPRSVDQTLGLVGLADRASARCGQLSGRQRRRLDVALALIGDPDLLFLDEPTTGFDPSARRAAWDVISSLRDLGKTIFLITHYMEEAERLADRIAVIARGRIVAVGTATDIGERATKASTVSFTLPPGASVADLPPTVACAAVACRDTRVEAKVSSALSLVGDLAGWAKERRLDLPDFGGHAAHARGHLSRVDRRAAMTVIEASIERSRRSFFGLVLHQYRADLRCLWRNKQSVFFHARPPGRVPFDLRVGVPPPERRRGGRKDRRAGVLRPRHHRLRPHRRDVLESRRLGRWLP